MEKEKRLSVLAVPRELLRNTEGPLKENYAPGKVGLLCLLVRPANTFTFVHTSPPHARVGLLRFTDPPLSLDYWLQIESAFFLQTWILVCSCFAFFEKNSRIEHWLWTVGETQLTQAHSGSRLEVMRVNGQCSREQSDPSPLH